MAEEAIVLLKEAAVVLLVNFAAIAVQRVGFESFAVAGRQVEFVLEGAAQIGNYLPRMVEAAAYFGAAGNFLLRMEVVHTDSFPLRTVVSKKAFVGN